LLATTQPIDEQFGFSTVDLDRVSLVPALVELNKVRLQQFGVRVRLKPPDYSGTVKRIEHDRLSWNARKRGAVRIMRSSVDEKAYGKSLKSSSGTRSVARNSA
jgi:hypothetical protein